MAFPNEWGASPNSGTNRCYDRVRTAENPRQGYPFYVEFTQSEGFCFIEWLAFNSNEYNPTWIGNYDTAKKEALSAGSVTINREENTQTGAIAATITINENIPVTLVPFCDGRPHIIQTNPPLINSGYYYTRGQQITIWMNLGYQENTEEFDAFNETFGFGEEQIQITGNEISSGLPWIDENDPENTNGNLEQFFNLPVYNPASQTITIEPKPDNPLPEYLTVTVTVGTGIIAANGYGMTYPVLFSYRITDEIVTKAYKANNVWAIHDPVNDRRPESFFYQMAPSDRDRHLRINKTTGKYEVSLYFTVSRSVGEIENPEPDTITVAEIYYAGLDGDESLVRDIREVKYKKFPPYGYKELKNMEKQGNTAGSIYRQMNPASNPLGVSYYEVKYSFDNFNADEADEENKDIDFPAGIYRLVVLPSGEGVPADDLDIAIAESRFVTVVIENRAPGGEGSIRLSGQGSRVNDIYTYNDLQNNNLIINTNFSDIRDNNGSYEITQNKATPDKPWTMDEQRNLSWKYRLVSGNEMFDRFEWLPMTVTQTQTELIELGMTPNETKEWDIEVKYKDSLNYETEWEKMGKIKFITYKHIKGVEQWSAVCSEGRETITITWVPPSGVTGVDIQIYSKIDGEAETGPVSIENYTEGSSYIINDIPEDVTVKYRIELYPAGYSVATEIIIWNFPEMTIYNFDELIEINSPAGFSNINNNLGTGNSYKQYVLTQSINIGSCMPIGSGTTSSNAFSGKFYGNNKTIYIYDFDPVSNIGLFGTTNNALIRDLTVCYNENISIDSVLNNGTTYFGGLVGYAMGNTSIINCKVEGNESDRFLELIGAGYLGGIAGFLTGASSIKDCEVSLDLGANSYHRYINGIAGFRNVNARVENSIFTGNLIIPNIVFVTNGNDSGPGSLRQAILDVPASGIIYVNNDVGTIILTSGRLEIKKSLTIEGNGVTLTVDASWQKNNTSQMMLIDRDNNSITVRIHSMHFYKGQSRANGGAIRKISGLLFLKSCIFNDNECDSDSGDGGGAIYNDADPIYIYGCTFYNNKVSFRGSGAAIFNRGSIELFGNLFYYNPTSSMYSTVCSVNGSITSYGYNVIDEDRALTSMTQSGGWRNGWDAHATDRTFAATNNYNLITIGVGFPNNSTFPFTGTPGNTDFTPLDLGTLRTHIQSAPAEFPEFDFYGNIRTLPGAPGAVR